MTVKERWNKWNEKLFRKNIFTGLLLVTSSLCLGFLCLAHAMPDNRRNMLESYFDHPWTIFLNLLPPVLFALILWLLTNRAVVAYGCTAGLFFTLAMANWYKLYFRNDPLMFGDLFLIQEANNMLERYHLFMTRGIFLSIVLILLGGVVMFFCGRGRLRSRWRFAAAAALVLLVLPVSRLYVNGTIYAKTANNKYVPRWSATGAYISRGFVYPFLHSVSSAFESMPEGYNKKDVEALLAQYEDQDIPEDRQVDMIGIMLEAYSDFSKYPQIAFMDDPYEKYHRLEAESFTGNLVTNIFAAGTVDTERAFVTGLASFGNLRSKTGSYAWYLRDQGYDAGGSHPCYDFFYNRRNINPNMGLDPYYFYENFYYDRDGAISPNDSLLPAITELYLEQAEETGAPQFSFSVTYQGHGPYNTEENEWGEEYVQPGAYSKETENILNNYLATVHFTNECLWDFVDEYRDMERPVIIVLFGDHNPWMGDNNSAYNEIGIDLDLSTQQGFMNYYCTRYLIWANDAAKQLLGEDFTGEGPDIAPCFLMNQVFELCGWEGPAYMQYTSQLMKELPVIHTSGSVLDKDGVLQREPDAAAQAKVREFEQVQYYMRHNFLYG